MDEYSLIGLFVSAFISSTLFPGGSEALLMYLAVQSDQSHILLWWVASLGNTLGGMTSWLLGRFISLRYSATSIIKPSHQRALNWVERWGSLALLLSWLPVIGDALCVAAGWVRVNAWLSLLLIFIGKAARYAVIIYWLS
jgi:membrane protein YqaA with SNARE-associated domain